MLVSPYYYPEGMVQHPVLFYTTHLTELWAPAALCRPHFWTGFRFSPIRVPSTVHSICSRGTLLQSPSQAHPWSGLGQYLLSPPQLLFYTYRISECSASLPMLAKLLGPCSVFPPSLPTMPAMLWKHASLKASVVLDSRTHLSPLQVPVSTLSRV